MKRILTYLIATLLFDTAIAAVLAMFTGRFWQEFTYSQCIGLTVAFISGATMMHARPGILRWVALCVTLPLSVALGMTLAFAVSGVGGWQNRYVGSTLALGLFFGLIGIIAVLLAERIGVEVKQRQLIEAESERREIEAHLRLLQAQIEPHFLFNTLANVSSLIESDPAAAKRLLERLNDWLRMALARARSDAATLGDELDMLENYLQILKIRFGERLRWRIAVPDGARGTPFPPMLLQPLVENAVRHGIEPLIGGGELAIAARIERGRLRIEVANSGHFAATSAGEGGAGLANVRARLVALFGGAGSLQMENRGERVAVTLELPA